MFTICFAVYASLVSVTPMQQECRKVDRAGLNAAVATCEALARDPLTTCEARPAGRLLWYVTVRRIEGT